GVCGRGGGGGVEAGGGMGGVGAAVDPGISDIALARLDDTGALDLTFGTGGISRHDIGSLAPPVSLARLGDGKLFVSAGGYAGNPAQFTREDFLRFGPRRAPPPPLRGGG